MSKILLFDIETSPIVAEVWGLWDQNIGLDQIVRDWSVFAYGAKWLGQDELIYEDTRNKKDLRDDRTLLKGIWKLLDEADAVITQNGKSFDSKKLNARFITCGMKPPSSYLHIDTKILAKRQFAFTSNKLEWLCETLNVKFKKLTDRKYPGHKLWKECGKGNLDAWREMERYNKRDVLALEGVYEKLRPWGTSINFAVLQEKDVCSCGSTKFVSNGFSYRATGKYPRFRCSSCGAEVRISKKEPSLTTLLPTR